MHRFQSTFLLLLALLLFPMHGLVPSTAAQSGTSDVAIVATENGQPIYDACFVLVNFSNEGCDENGDGQITFQDVPLGTYTVTQTRELGTGRSIPDTTITVTGATDADGWERFYLTVSSSGGSSGQTSSSQGGSSDIAVVATENGQPVYDACFILVGYGNEGCDENRDGKITFEDVPLGSYTLRQTQDLGSGRSIQDATIQVRGAADSDGWERFPVSVSSSGSSSQGNGGIGVMSVSATTCDANGTCYYEIGVEFTVATLDGDYIGSCTLTGDRWAQLEIAGSESCDVSVPYDVELVITQDISTITPGTAPVENPLYYTRTLGNTPSYVGVIFSNEPISGIASNGQSVAVDISLITRDPNGGRLVTGTCYVLVGYSNEGCDENGDGQVTFEDVPGGTYTVRQTQTPTGFPTVNDFPIAVEDTYPNVPVGYLVRQAADQNAPRTRNVSVVFVDSQQGTKVVSSICVEFVGGSNVGCDRDLVDGQIDFLDVPYGTYATEFSNVPGGWQMVNGIPSLTVTSGTGPEIVYVAVDVAGSSSGGATTESGSIAVVGGDQTNTSPSDPSSSNPTSGSAAVELILDTSGSMNERDQGTQTRLEVAKAVTTRLVTETLPAGSTMGLRTYSGCSSSLAIPLQPLDPTSATATIGGLRATGQTPIGQSLQAAAADLTNVAGPKIIVLVTDGEETCGGDPRQAIAALVAQDITIQVNIVGFAIDDTALTETFREWARVGNGTYYQASNELELDQAVTTATQLSFDVIDQRGAVVAESTVGGDAVSVPIGTYTVDVDTVPATRYANVVVEAQQTTTIDLTTGGASGTGGQAGNQGQNTQVIVPTDDAQANSGTAQESWTASVQVSLCDAPANSGHETNCGGGAGVVVNISLASGEFLGSCTTGEPMDTPWGFTLSHCTVPGMPFNADLVASQDLSTIPAGYEPVNNTSSFSIGDMDMGNGDGATFGFTNVRTSTGSTTQSGVTNTSNASATLLMTFRACPEGFDPNTGDFFAECTIPLDAPDASFLYYGGDGQGGQNIAWLDRQYNGAYIFNAVAQTMNLQLSGLAPEVRNAYEVIGADSGDGSTFTVNLVDGETREVFIFYYFA